MAELVKKKRGGGAEAVSCGDQVVYIGWTDVGCVVLQVGRTSRDDQVKAITASKRTPKVRHRPEGRLNVCVRLLFSFWPGGGLWDVSGLMLA